MDIAIGLGLAVAGQTWRAYRQRAASGEYVAYALRGGAELLNLRLHRAVAVAKSDNAVETGGFQLTWQGAAAHTPRVRLEMAPARKVERARHHVCSGFEISWHRSAALVASGVLTFALAVLSGADCAQAAVAQMPAQATRSVQCPAEAPRADRLLAEITEAARYRAFSRTRDSNKVGSSGDGGHSNVTTHRAGDSSEEKIDVEENYRVFINFDSDTDETAYNKPQSVRIEYTNLSNKQQHINTTVETLDPNGKNGATIKKKISVVVNPPDANDSTSKYIVDGWDDKAWDTIPDA